ncbi:tetratricopeptide repeat protein [Chlamydiota bacterium]
MKRCYTLVVLGVMMWSVIAINADESQKYLDFWETKNKWQTHALKGLSLLKNKQYHGAKEEILKAISLGAEKGELLYQLGVCNEKLGKANEAIDAFTRSIAILKDEKEKESENYLFYAYYNIGVLLLKREQKKEALPYFDNASIIKPSHARTHVYLATIYSDFNEKERAIVEYEKAIKFDQTLSNVYYNLSILHKENGDIKKAKAYFEKAKALDPHLPDILFVISVREVTKKIENVSNTDFERLKKQAKTANEFFSIGAILFKKGEVDEAITALKKSIRLDQSYGNSYLLLAELFLEINQVGKALRVYEDYLQFNPQDAAIFLKIGRLYLEKKQYLLAKKYLQKAIAVEQNNFEAHFLYASALEYNQAGVHYGDGFDFETVIKEYKSCLQLRKDSIESFVNLGTVYGYLGKTDEAKKVFTYIPQLTVTSPVVYYNLGCIYDELGLNQDAITAFQKAIDLDPYFYDALFNLGFVLVKARDVKSAVRVYEKLLKSNPDYTDVLLNLAIVYDKYLKDKRKANHYYHRFMYKNPEALMPQKKLIKKRILRLNPE